MTNVKRFRDIWRTEIHSNFAPVFIRQILVRKFRHVSINEIVRILQ